jgi:hypothetical protein
MNEQENILRQERMSATSKIMMYAWLNELFNNKQADFDSENSNIIVLGAFPSSWFCIGREEENKVPFLAIQEGMTPWFIHIPWERAIVDQEGGMLYLTCAQDGGGEDLTIAIKGRKARLKVFTYQQPEESKMDFRLVKIFPNGDVDVSNDSFKQVSLTRFKAKNDIVLSPRVLSSSLDSEYELELKNLTFTTKKLTQ